MRTAQNELDQQLQVVLSNIEDPRNLVFFLGAGISHSAGYPLWDAATQRAVDHAGQRGLSPAALAYATELLQGGEYYEVFEVLQRRLPKSAFCQIASRVFSGSDEPSEVHRLVVRVNCRGIITTNFDECLLTACITEGRSVPITDMRYAVASDAYFIVKPHGSVKTPESMVLSRTDWQRVAATPEFRELLAQAVSMFQVVFIGYGMRDPDINRIWDDILRHRCFRAPALYFCRRGGLDAGRLDEFRERNVQVVEFPDDGSFAFIRRVLEVLAQRGGTPAGRAPARASQEAARDLERYLLLCLHFAPEQQSRLIVVVKALVLEALSCAASNTISRDVLQTHIAVVLGREASHIAPTVECALQELVAAGLARVKGGLVEFDRQVFAGLQAKVAELERAESDWVKRVLREQASALGASVDSAEEARVLEMFDQVVMEAGHEIAELLLFNRASGGERAKIDEVVDRACEGTQFAERKALYRKTLRQVVLDPAEGIEEDLLFKKLQAYLIAAAYVLNPTSEKLLADYARGHWVYLDSSLILPALAVGHPANSVYRRLLHRTQVLGMRLKVIRDMANEVWANVREAVRALEEFDRTDVSLVEVLEGYVAFHGSGNGNVFLEGLLGRLRLDPTVSPAAYMSSIVGPNLHSITEEQIVAAIGGELGIECDVPRQEEFDPKRLALIVASVEHLRKQAGRYKTRRLCEHEARQFYVINLRREQNPELQTRIWFVTTDRFIGEVQRLERERYPLPIAYSPRAWFQYLDLVDFESRGSRHFSRLQPKMRFGVFVGDMGIEAIRTILSQRGDLLKRGVVSVKEFAEAAVRDHHVQQCMAEYDRYGAWPLDKQLQAEARARIRTEVSRAVAQVVTVRTQELDRLKEKTAAAEREKQKLEKRLAKEKHVVSTLRSQQRPRKRRRRPR